MRKSTDSEVCLAHSDDPNDECDEESALTRGLCKKHHTQWIRVRQKLPDKMHREKFDAELIKNNLLLEAKVAGRREEPNKFRTIAEELFGDEASRAEKLKKETMRNVKKTIAEKKAARKKPSEN